MIDVILATYWIFRVWFLEVVCTCFRVSFLGLISQVSRMFFCVFHPSFSKAVFVSTKKLHVFFNFMFFFKNMSLNLKWQKSNKNQQDTIFF